jgi:hypothetical protein
MKYMLLYAGDETAGGLAADPVADGESDEPVCLPWKQEMQARRVVLVSGGRLQQTSAATTVRTAGTEVLVADGPFAETKEQILGFDVIECADLDEAIYAASRHPVAILGGVVEVRPMLAGE